MKLRSLILTPVILAALHTSSALAALVVTYAELPDAVISTVSNTSMFTFDNLSTFQKLTDVPWTGVGTYDQLYIKPADTYGGAVDGSYPSGSPYSRQGPDTPVSTTTLALSQPSAYFGFLWSAGDKTNVMDFYSGNSLVAKFTTTNLMKNLSSSYYGNPRNRALDYWEPTGFINFYGDLGTSWDKIVFSNNSITSAFESDNHTSRVGAWGTQPGDTGPMPGIPLERVEGLVVTSLTAVPEPSGIMVTGSVLALGLCIRRRSAI